MLKCGSRSASTLGARSTDPSSINCTGTTVNASTTPNNTTCDDATHDPSPPRRRRPTNVERNAEQRSSAPCAYLFNIPNLVFGSLPYG
jgi:hypothetical protein